VLLNSGTYTFTNTSTFTALNNVTIEGQGPSTSIEYNIVNGRIMVFNATSVLTNRAVTNYSAQEYFLHLMLLS